MNDLFSLALCTGPTTTARFAHVAQIRRWFCGTLPLARSHANSGVMPGWVLLFLALCFTLGIVVFHLEKHLRVFMAAALLFVPVYLFYVIFLLSVSFSNFPLQKVNCVQFNEEATVILSGESALCQSQLSVNSQSFHALMELFLVFLVFA